MEFRSARNKSNHLKNLRRHVPHTSGNINTEDCQYYKASKKAEAGNISDATFKFGLI